MHMGGIATIGDMKLKNFTHILLNNRSHESVGGQRTTSKIINYAAIAKASGYQKVYEKIDNLSKLKNTLKKTKKLKH